MHDLLAASRQIRDRTQPAGKLVFARSHAFNVYFCAPVIGNELVGVPHTPDDSRPNQLLEKYY